MPYTPVPGSELTIRLNHLRCAMTAHDADWSMLLLENKIDLFYFTGTMQDGILIITPSDACFFIRHSYECAARESRFAAIEPMRSFREIAAKFPAVPSTVYVAAATLTLQKLSMLQKHLPFSHTRSADAVLRRIRSVKSDYELDCMRTAGAIQREVFETIIPQALTEGTSEAALCMEGGCALLTRGAMGISRFNQAYAEDVLGVCSFGENALCAAAIDSPSGIVGTSLAMKSIGSAARTLRQNDLVLLDLPSGFRGYHTDKSANYFVGDPATMPDGATLVAAHEECVRLEKLAASLCKPGALPSAIYERICCEVAAPFAEGFMNHCKFLGHSIGLTMDETPVLAASFHEPLCAGMVLAIEPKIALPGIGLAATENTYEITPTGGVSLTGDATAAWVFPLQEGERNHV